MVKHLAGGAELLHHVRYLPAGPLLGGPVAAAGAGRLTDTLLIDDGVLDPTSVAGRVEVGRLCRRALLEAVCRVNCGFIRCSSGAVDTRSCPDRLRSAGRIW